jgi:lipoate---protein ligase
MPINDVNLIEYNLPDMSLFVFTEKDKADISLWIPDKVMVIIGKGSDIESELNIKNIIRDNVPLLRRNSGGCAVVLSPDMLICSMAIYHQKLINPMKFFKLFSNILIEAFRISGVPNVEQKGISDLSVNEKKIAGSSIYRNRYLVFYHCVINIEGDARLFDYYLKHPPREPAYRKGRKHSDFVSSIRAFGFDMSKEALMGNIRKVWAERIKKISDT